MGAPLAPHPERRCVANEAASMRLAGQLPSRVFGKPLLIPNTRRGARLPFTIFPPEPSLPAKHPHDTDKHLEPTMDEG